MPFSTRRPRRPAVALAVALAVVAAAALPSTATAATASRTLVAAGATWRVNATGTLAPGWERKVFDDSAWPLATAEVGAGDGNEVTVVNRLAPAHPTDFFRTTFTVAERAATTAATLTLVADDGAVVYLNGARVVSDNMNWSGTAAATARTGAAEHQARNFALPVSRLVDGANTVAVAVFQTSSRDADMSFSAAVTTTVTVPSATTSSTSAPSGAAAAPSTTAAVSVTTVPSGSVPTTTATSTTATSTTVPPTSLPTTTSTTSAAPPTTATTVPSPTAPATGGASTFRPASVTASIGGCEVHSRDHFLNATGVDRLPVRAESATWTGFLGGAATPLRAGFGAAVWSGSRAGMPMNVVDSRRTGKSSVLLDHTYTDSYAGGYPVPWSPVVEGDPHPEWDRHLIMVDQADCTSYELIQYDSVWKALFGSHKALAGARVPLTGTAAVPTTNAAQTPMVGQNVLVSEVAAGRVDHAVGFCTTELSPRHLWPARASDGRSSNAAAIPTGAWLRLRGSVDRTRFSGQARPIVDAMVRHGIVLTDTCGLRFALMGENSSGWNDTELAQLGRLTAADFEVVDTAPMKVSDASWAIR